MSAPAKILVVDDDPQVLNSLGIRLKEEGYRVFRACNGMEAQKVFKNEAVDLVVLDIFMPTMDGLETLNQMRDMELSPKVIAITGGGNPKANLYLELAVAFGVHLTLKKPFSGRQLLEGIHSLLAGDVA